MKLADKPPRIGDWVLAVGNPFGLGGTVTAGIVSARGRDIGAGPYDDFIQIDAPVNRGNSGGPTFDVDGNVIGVNTAIFSPSGGNVGIAFAIPAETVKMVVAQLREKGSVTRGWIGVQIQPVTPDIADSLGLKKAEGALVAEPQADSPAAKAGIKAGDVIVTRRRHAGEGCARAGAQDRQLWRPAPRSSSASSARAPSRRVTVTLGEIAGSAARSAGAAPTIAQPRQPMSPALGLTLAPAGTVGGAGGQGVVVTAVDPNGLGGRPRLPHRRRDPRGRRPGGVEPGGRPQGAGRRPRRREAQRADAGEVGRSDQVRGRPARTRLIERDVPPAFVAPAGGRPQGTGQSLVPAFPVSPGSVPHASPPGGTR